MDYTVSPVRMQITQSCFHMSMVLKNLTVLFCFVLQRTWSGPAQRAHKIHLTLHTARNLGGVRRCESQRKFIDMIWVRIPEAVMEGRCKQLTHCRELATHQRRNEGMADAWPVGCIVRGFDVGWKLFTPNSAAWWRCVSRRGGTQLILGIYDATAQCNTVHLGLCLHLGLSDIIWAF